MGQISVATLKSMSSASISGRTREHVFFSVMSLALVLTVFAGFAPSYYLRPASSPPLPMRVHLHGIVFTSWMLLLLVQTSLVAAHRVRLHRRLGMAGSLIAVIMVVFGTWVAIAAAAEGKSPGPPPLVFLAIPLTEMIVFPTLVGMGIYYRRRTDSHKRLMLIATISVASAAVGRFPFAGGPLVFFGLTDLFLVPIFVFDFYSRGRLHAATFWGSLFLIASQVVRVLISGTEAWLQFAAWLTGATT